MAVEVGGYRISLDTGDPEANVSFVSHAHSDHISGLRKDSRIIASKATRDLIAVRNRKELDIVDGIEQVKLLNSGHILGSKQLYVESADFGHSLVYSGDYQMQECSVADRIETRQADIAVIDSTYPYPKVKFDDRSEVVDSIQTYVNSKLERGVVLFGAYTLGKAQELTKIMNNIGVLPVVDDRISRINKVYERSGVELQYTSQLDDKDTCERIMRGNFVGIVNVSRLDSARCEFQAKLGKRVFTAVATGWAKIFKFNTDVQFALSDHADFCQALDYINACGAKLVYTYGENRWLFARNLKKLGYNALPLAKAEPISRKVADR